MKNLNQVRVLKAIRVMTNERTANWFTMEQIRRESGLSLLEVDRIISELIDMNEVRWARDGAVNVYSLGIGS